MNTTNWTPGLIVLVVGAISAVIILLTTKKKSESEAEVFAADQKDILADHDRKVQELIEELRELDQDQHHLPAEAFIAEKARLELEAAKALKARDEFARKMGAPPAVKPGAQP